MCIFTKKLYSVPILSACWVTLHNSLLPANFPSKPTSIKNTIRVSNSLDPNQARPFVWPILGPYCLQKLSTENTNRQRINLSAYKTLSLNCEQTKSTCAFLCMLAGMKKNAKIFWKCQHQIPDKMH